MDQYLTSGELSILNFKYLQFFCLFFFCLGFFFSRSKMKPCFNFFFHHISESILFDVQYNGQYGI